MVSIEQEREAMFKKLQLLRSITNSHAHDKESVVLEASKYIKDFEAKGGTIESRHCYSGNLYWPEFSND
ncbi:hypothetical protein OIU77_006685 [Salix suchowensis]|uniref:Uncharacterized protein n=1 Tax=Salix suchowensis TaxID=1278906 RepID=A0ABQ9ALK5_9ROSI|nr:hypothetical protein OIU77_006685 [Salix suchowensis]